MINPALTTTSFVLDGYRVNKTLGVVRGITVRSRSIFGTLGASLQTIVGGNITFQLAASDLGDGSTVYVDITIILQLKP